MDPAAARRTAVAGAGRGAGALRRTDRIPAAVASLAKELLTIEATGDRSRAERWFAKYDKMPADLSKALAGITDVPVDVEPIWDFPVTPQ